MANTASYRWLSFAYVLASFKDGFYDGGYKEYVDNILITEGSYKEGWKDGLQD